MGVLSWLSKPVASWMIRDQTRWSMDAVNVQRSVFHQLIKGGLNTLFGRDHDFASIHNFENFQQRVPIADYEDLGNYIDRVVVGESDILWKGKPIYLAKTSGTTSGTKYIPITKESMPNHINSARNALLSYIHDTGNSHFLNGKLIFLSGSPVLNHGQTIPTGRLSGIVNHHVPGYLRTNQMPSYQTKCIEDWEQKIDEIIEETLQQDMTLISGIPPWVQMYFDRIIAKTGKKIKDVFPNFSLMVHGGVNFGPYRAKLFDSIGAPVDAIETYPASEGFIAYQDSQTQEGLLLLLDSGIFFEFIPDDQYFQEKPDRLTIGEVEIGVNYVLILSNNAGLWAYSLGDIVKFVSKNPYRLVVTGRIKHFISAFGEHVIGEDVEKAMKLTLELHPETELVEFTVAPQVTPKQGLPLHQWYIEFSHSPRDLTTFEKGLNLQLQKLNSYYDDLITGKILKCLEVISLKKEAFRDYMKSQGKLGGQNKVPRLSNDRKIVDHLDQYKLS